MNRLLIDLALDPDPGIDPPASTYKENARLLRSMGVPDLAEWSEMASLEKALEGEG